MVIKISSYRVVPFGSDDQVQVPVGVDVPDGDADGLRGHDGGHGRPDGVDLGGGEAVPAFIVLRFVGGGSGENKSNAV